MEDQVRAKPFGTFLETQLPPRKDWIKDGFLTRKGTAIIAAASKTGKSLFSMEMCRALVTGTNPFGCPSLSVPDPARVLYVEDEVKEYGLQERGLQIFKGVSRGLLDEQMHIISGAPQLRFDEPDGWKILRRELTNVRPNVLILDPIGRFIGGLDENSNAEMGKVLSRLDQILFDYADEELSLLIVHHSRKPDMSPHSRFDPLSPHSMRGASRFYANPDTIMMLNREKEKRNKDGHVMWEVEGHIETRQAEPLPNIKFTVNEESDLRVRYKHFMGVNPVEEKRREKSVTPPPTKLTLKKETEPEELDMFPAPEPKPWRN